MEEVRVVERARSWWINTPRSSLCDRSFALRVGTWGWWLPLLIVEVDDHSHHCHRRGRRIGKGYEGAEEPPTVWSDAVPSGRSTGLLLRYQSTFVILGVHLVDIGSVRIVIYHEIKIRILDSIRISNFPRNPEHIRISELRNQQSCVGDIVLSQQYAFKELLMWWDIVLDYGISRESQYRIITRRIKIRFRNENNRVKREYVVLFCNVAVMRSAPRINDSVKRLRVLIQWGHPGGKLETIAKP